MYRYPHGQSTVTSTRCYKYRKQEAQLDKRVLFQPASHVVSCLNSALIVNVASHVSRVRAAIGRRFEAGLLDVSVTQGIISDCPWLVQAINSIQWLTKFSHACRRGNQAR